MKCRKKQSVNIRKWVKKIENTTDGSQDQCFEIKDHYHTGNSRSYLT